MKNFYTLLFLFICIANSHLIGQIIPSIPSPIAANLGLYGEIPVSYYTGTPNISIPLYEIKGKHVNVPISLTYHPSAIRPEIHPGPTGLGWTLQAGGVITRTVRGKSTDECDYGNRMGSISGYLEYAGGWIAQADWKTNAQTGCANSFNCRNAVWNMAPFSDIEPDEFSFSFLGISGKFYFDQNGGIQVQCDRPVKVIFNNEFIQAHEIGFEYQTISEFSYFHRMIKSFTIIDEFGNHYSFGGKDAIELSDPISYGTTTNGGFQNNRPAFGYLLQATSWFLTKIESMDGSDVIDFTYERGPFVSQLFRSFDSYSYSGAGSSGWGIDNLVLGGTLICPVYLKTISRTNGEKILFSLSKSDELTYTKNDYQRIFFYSSYDDYLLLDKTQSIPRLNNTNYSDKFDRIQWLKLDNIAISNNQNQPIRSVSFIYNNNSTERLFLKQLIINGGSTSNVTPQSDPDIQQAPFTIPNLEIADQVAYSFSYKDRNNMPAYLEGITDHWGFNNGRKFSSGGFISTQRTPNAYYVVSGVLDTIYYPTGGYTCFEYEMHDYAKVVNTKNRTTTDPLSGTAGGLRVKKIKTNDLLGNEITREFYYRTTLFSSTSSGVLNVLPTYAQTISGRDTDNKPFTISHFRSYPAIPLTTENDGQYIGYTTVFEKRSNGEGHIKYTFTNHDNGYCDRPPLHVWHREIFPSDPHNSRFFERGRLLEETCYNANDIPIKKSNTTWSRYDYRGMDDPLFEEHPRAFHFGGLKVGYDYCSSVAYLHYTYKFLPSKRTEIIYDINGGQPITNVLDYSYNSLGLLIGEKKTINNLSLNTIYRYPLEVLSNTVNLPPLNGFHVLVRDMYFRGMTGIPIEINTIYNGLYTDVNLCLYSYFGDQIQLSHQVRLAVNLPVADYLPLHPNRSPDSRLSTETTYNLYDSKGNILQVTGRDSIAISFVWGYRYQHPIAKIEGATYAQVKTALGRSGDSNNDLAYLQKFSSEQLQVEFEKLRQNLPTALVSTYTYFPQVGICSETNPSRITIYYEYDSLGRLKTVKDHLGNVLQQYEYKYGAE